MPRSRSTDRAHAKQRVSTQFSSEKNAGFALAAVLAGDRELAYVQGHIDADDLARVRAIATSPHLAKPVLLAQLLAHLHPPLTELAPTLPLRLRALLATRVRRIEGRHVVAEAPLTRAGFEPEPELVARLIRIARFSSAEAERERLREQAEVRS